MTLSPAQRALLRRGTTTVILGIFSSALLLGMSWLKLDHQQAALNEQEQSLQEARTRRAKAERALLVIKDELPRFKALEASGLIGDEKRLMWIQALVQTSEALRLSSMRYKIDAQEVYAPDFVNFGGNYEVRRSDMTIITQSLHELDVINVIDNLESTAPGLFQVSECEIQRLQKELIPSMDLPNVMAECRLRWFSVHYTASNTQPG